MGRLPETFAGQRIHYRIPFILKGVLPIASASGPTQFPTSTFMQTEDKPFEIHRMIPRVIAVNGSNNPVNSINNDLMMRCISMQIEDLGKDQFFTKQPINLLNFVKGTTEKSWEWADPYYLRKSENLVVNLTSATYPAAITDTAAYIQVQIAFEGFLIVIAPPSDRR